MVNTTSPFRFFICALIGITSWGLYTPISHAQDEPQTSENNEETVSVIDKGKEENKENKDNALTASAYAIPTPIPARNLNPFIQIFGIPIMETATLVPVGKSQLTIHYDVVNNAIQGKTGPETLIIDGETYRTSIIWRKGLSNSLEVGIEIPFISHSSGLFDQHITGWHDIFQLSNSDRDARPDNSLSYYYYREYDVAYNISCCNSDNPEIGDIRFFASQPIIRSTTKPISLTASIKAPTGNENKLKGSGDVDFTLALNSSNSERYQQWKITTFGQLGLIMIGQNHRDGLALANLRREAALFAGYGASWRYLPKLDLKAQFNVHTSMYNSEISALGTFSSMLTVGLTSHLNKRLTLDLHLGENLFTDTVPDVMINSAIAWRY